MNDFQFISYIPTPNDQYMLGIAKIKAFGKLELRYKHVKTKDGSGTFFCTNNFTTQDASGEKKYLPCFLLDSRSDEENLMDLLRDGVNRAIHAKSAIPHQPASPNAYYPNGLAQPAQQMASQEQLPF